MQKRKCTIASKCITTRRERREQSREVRERVNNTPSKERRLAEIIIYFHTHASIPYIVY